jgi:hypothetical protein
MGKESFPNLSHYIILTFFLLAHL